MVASMSSSSSSSEGGASSTMAVAESPERAMSSRWACTRCPSCFTMSSVRPRRVVMRSFLASRAILRYSEMFSFLRALRRYLASRPSRLRSVVCHASTPTPCALRALLLATLARAMSRDWSPTSLRNFLRELTIATMASTSLRRRCSSCWRLRKSSCWRLASSAMRARAATVPAPAAAFCMPAATAAVAASAARAAAMAT
mmetsp:Transcript_14726/g.46900  ORF Transcript_14726/g.46900 Transcript_14726/m.46900 type:complete len:200 (+) Transcript_14726:1955-2554(+)